MQAVAILLPQSPYTVSACLPPPLPFSVHLTAWCICLQHRSTRAEREPITEVCSVLPGNWVMNNHGLLRGSCLQTQSARSYIREHLFKPLSKAPCARQGSGREEGREWRKTQTLNHSPVDPPSPPLPFSLPSSSLFLHLLGLGLFSSAAPFQPVVPGQKLLSPSHPQIFLGILFFGCREEVLESSSAWPFSLRIDWGFRIQPVSLV